MDPEPEVIFLPRRASLESPQATTEDLRVEGEPSQEAASTESKLNLLIRLCEQQNRELQQLQQKLGGVDEKLNSALLGGAPRPTVSFQSKQSKHSFRSSNPTPIQSSGMADFNDLDQMLGVRVMKAAKHRHDGPGDKLSIFKRSGTYHVGGTAPQTSASRRVNFGANGPMSSSQMSLSLPDQ